MLNQRAFPNLCCLHPTENTSCSAKTPARGTKAYASAFPWASYPFPAPGRGRAVKVRNDLSAGRPLFRLGMPFSEVPPPRRQKHLQTVPYH